MEAWKKRCNYFERVQKISFLELTAIIKITYVHEEELNHKSYLWMGFSNKLLYVYDKSGFPNMNRLKITTVWLTVYFISRMQGQYLHLQGPSK